MKGRAVFDGRCFVLEEVLPGLEFDSSIVICKNDDGKRFACPLQIWEDHAEIDPAVQGGTVTNYSSSDEKVALFRSLFHGREDLFAKRWYNIRSGQSGYSPACGNEWVSGLCNKKAVSCKNCTNKDLLPITDEIIYQHLRGNDEYARDVIGLYPMNQDETTFVLAIDFDGEGWQNDISAFISVCTNFNLHPAVERSRSGNGGHVWFFFSEAVSAASARKLGSGLLSRTMEHHAALKMKSYDRLFPNQDTLPKGGFGNLIALPLQGLSRRSGNSVFVDNSFEPWPDQWAFLSSVEKLDSEQLDNMIHIVCRGGELGELSDTGHSVKPWERIQPTVITPADFLQTVELTLADGIYVKKNGISDAALNKIKRLAAFRNPDFYKAQAMRLPTYNKPRVIDTALDLHDFLKIPRGCLNDLKEMLPEYSICDNRNPGRPIDVSFNGILRDEQAPAANALLDHETGVLSATTAFGKTVIGAHLIGELKVNTLVLVHTSALLTQWKSALEQFLDIAEPLEELPPKRGRRRKRSKIGLLGAVKNTINGIVDIAIMQSLTDGDEVKALVQDYGLVICDECHHVPAVSFERVLSTVKAKYVYGLTATPLRPDGHQPIIFMQCGPIRYKVDAKEQAAKRNFDHFIIPRFVPTRIPDSEELSIQEIYTKITSDEMRNQYIIKDVKSSVDERRSPLILTGRKEHAEILAELLQGTCSHILLLVGSEGQKLKREKLEALKAIPQDESLIVVATGRYIGEGFDEPRLDTLFLVMPIAWKGTLAQYAGRLHRDYKGKCEVLIYDYVDIHIRVLEKMYQKRLRGYAEMGYQAKADGNPEKISAIFDHHTFYSQFAEDIAGIRKDALIVSPLIRKSRINSIIKILAEPLKQKAKITVVTRPPEDYKQEQQPVVSQLINLLKESGILVITHSGIHQKYAVFDRGIVWYGSISFLSFDNREENSMRFENSTIAGELYDAALSDNQN